MDVYAKLSLKWTNEEGSSIETNDLLRKLAVLTGVMTRGESKIEPSQVANCAMKIVEQRLFSLPHDPVQRGPRAHEELRALVRVILASSEAKRRSQKSLVGTDETSSTSQGSRTGKISIFELFRRKIAISIFKVVNDALNEQDVTEVISASKQVQNDLFLIACIETWVFYTSCEPKTVKRGSKLHDAFVQCNKQCMLLCARLITTIRGRIPNNNSNGLTWKLKETQIALYKVLLSCIDLGETFIVPFVKVLGAVDNTPGAIVRSISDYRPSSVKLGRVEGVVSRATHAYLKWKTNNRRLSVQEWTRELDLCFRADVEAEQSELYENQFEAPCTIFALKHCADQCSDLSTIPGCLAQLVVQCVSVSESRGGQTRVAIAVKESDVAMRCILKLPWDVKTRELLWESLVQLTLEHSRVDTKSAHPRKTFHFFKTYAEVSPQHMASARKSALHILRESGAADPASHSLDPLLLHGCPNWSFLASLGIQAWASGCENRELMSNTSLAISVLASMEPWSPPARTSQIVNSSPDNRHEWLRALACLADLIRDYVETADESPDSAWEMPMTRSIRELTTAALVVWTCPAILRRSSAAKSGASIRSQMVQIGFSVAKSAAFTLRELAESRRVLNLKNPGNEEANLMECVSKFYMHVKRAGCSRSNKELMGEYRRLVKCLLEVQIIIDPTHLDRKIQARCNLRTRRFEPAFSDVVCGVPDGCLGKLDKPFAREFIQQLENGFDARRLRTRSSISLIKTAVRQFLEGDHQKVETRTLCSAIRLCGRVLRDFTPTCEQCDDAEAVLCDIIQYRQASRTQELDAVIETALCCVLGVPLTKHEPWQWPLASRIVQSMMVALKADEIQNIVLTRILTSFWRTEYPSPCLCATYAVALAHCSDERILKLDEENQRLSIPGDSPVRWASLAWKSGADEKFRSPCTNEGSVTRVENKTQSRILAPTTRDEFWSRCTCAADSESLVNVPVESLLLGVDKKDAFEWLSEWACAISASRNEGSALVAFRMWMALTQQNDADGRNNTVGRALCSVLFPFMTRKTTTGSTVLCIQQNCIEPLSPCARTLASPWDTRSSVAQWMTELNLSGCLHILIEAAILYSSSADSAQKDNRLLECAMTALNRASGDFDRSFVVIEKWIRFARDSGNLRVQFTWLKLTAGLITHSPSCKDKDTKLKIRLATYAFLQNFLTLCPSGDWRDPDLGWWVQGKTITSVAVYTRQIYAGDQLLPLVRKHCVTVWTDTSPVLFWFHCVLRAYMAWAQFSSQRVESGGVPAAVYALCRASDRLIDKKGNLAVQLRNNLNDTNACYSLVQYVVEDALRRSWGASVVRHVQSSILVFLKDPVTSPAAWEGFARYLCESCNGIKNYRPYLNAAKYGLLPVKSEGARHIESKRAIALTRVMRATERVLSHRRSFGESKDTAPLDNSIIEMSRSLVNAASHPEWYDGMTCLVDADTTISEMESAARSLWALTISTLDTNGSLPCGLVHLPLEHEMDAHLWAFSSINKLMRSTCVQRDASFYHAFIEECLWYARCELYPNGTHVQSSQSSDLFIQQWAKWVICAARGVMLEQESIIGVLLQAMELKQSKGVYKTGHGDIIRSIATMCAGIAYASCSGIHRTKPVLSLETLLRVIKRCSVVHSGLHITLNEIGKQMEKFLLRQNAWKDDAISPTPCVSVADVLESRCETSIQAGEYRTFLCESLSACSTYLKNEDFQEALNAVLDGDILASIQILLREFKKVQDCSILSSKLKGTMLRALAIRGRESDRALVMSALERMGQVDLPEAKSTQKSRRELVLRRASSTIQACMGQDMVLLGATKPPTPIFIGRNSGLGLNRELLPQPDRGLYDLMNATCASVRLWAEHIDPSSAAWGSQAFVSLSKILMSLPPSIQRLTRGPRNRRVVRFTTPPIAEAVEACARVARRLSEAVSSPPRAARTLCEQLARDLVPFNLQHHLPKPPRNSDAQVARLVRNFTDTRCINMFAHTARCTLLIVSEIGRVCSKYKCTAGQCALAALKMYGGAHGSTFSYAHARHAAAIGLGVRREHFVPCDPYACGSQLHHHSTTTRDSHTAREFVYKRMRSMIYSIPGSIHPVFAKAFVFYWAMRCSATKDERVILSPDQVKEFVRFSTEVTLDSNTTTYSTWEVSARSFIMSCILQQCRAELYQTKESVYGFFSQSASCLSWMSGAIGAAEYLEPEHIAFVSPVPLALRAVLGGIMFNDRRSALSIVDHLFGNEKSIVASCTPGLARRAVYSAHRVATTIVDVDQKSAHSTGSLDLGEEFFNLLDDVLAPTKYEHEALLIFDRAEILVKKLSESLSSGIFDASAAREYEAAAERVLPKTDATLKLFKNWMKSAIHEQKTDPDDDLLTDISSRLARTGARLCASLCDRATSALRIAGEEGKRSQVERGIKELNEWIECHSTSINGVYHSTITIPSAKDDSTASEYLIISVQAPPKEEMISLAWVHPDLSTPWAQRTYIRLRIHAKSESGSTRIYSLTIHWKPQGVWSHPASFGALGALTATSLVSGFEAFCDRPTVRAKGGAGFGDGIQPSAAASLRGPPGAYRKVLASGRSAYFIPHEETRCRRTLAHVLFTETESLRTFGDYILRSVVISNSHACFESSNPLFSLRKLMIRSSEPHNIRSPKFSFRRAQRILAECSAAWFATHGGSSAIYREAAWPSMVVCIPDGTLEFPLDLDALAGRPHEIFPWNDMIVSSMDSHTLQAHFLPAVRFYRKTCMMHRDEMSAALALSYMCSGGNTHSLRMFYLSERLSANLTESIASGGNYDESLLRALLECAEQLLPNTDAALTQLQTWKYTVDEECKDGGLEQGLAKAGIDICTSLRDKWALFYSSVHQAECTTKRLFKHRWTPITMRTREDVRGNGDPGTVRDKNTPKTAHSPPRAVISYADIANEVQIEYKEHGDSQDRRSSDIDDTNDASKAITGIMHRHAATRCGLFRKSEPKRTSRKRKVARSGERTSRRTRKRFRGRRKRAAARY